jgi:peroxiredoxin
LEHWDEVADAVESAQVRIYGLTIDSLHKVVEFTSKNPFRYHVLIPDDSKAFMKSYKTYGVPQTILISKQGIAEEVILGMLSEEKIKKIVEKAFS